jgi:hypothetical protein
MTPAHVRTVLALQKQVTVCFPMSSYNTEIKLCWPSQRGGYGPSSRNAYVVIEHHKMIATFTITNEYGIDP